MNISFVVLHYESINDTCKCIESILKLIPGSNTINIVIVDNGSKKNPIGDSFPYTDECNVFIIRSKTNLGFARGNNLGFTFAKNHLYADVIILSNNDIVFSQPSFISILEEKLESEPFDCGGPRIISLVDGMDQNPVYRIYHDRRDVLFRLLKKATLYCLSVVHADLVVQAKFGGDKSKYPNHSKSYDNCEIQLHGACLIFANRFVREREGICNKTFMYGEEEILVYEIERDGMSMRYIEDLEVRHNEGSSTKLTYGDGIKKRRFFYRNGVHGCYVLLKMMIVDKYH